MDFEEATKKVLETDDLYQFSEYTHDGQIYKAFVNTPQTLHELLEYGKKLVNGTNLLFMRMNELHIPSF